LFAAIESLNQDSQKRCSMNWRHLLRAGDRRDK
jgi:hypothetical protein